MSPASNTSGAPLPSVAILGVDALLAARPATPVQLAHACQAAGYAAVYPVTWGDELLATACVRRLATRGDDPAIFCACPHVSDALLEVGSDLARFLIPLVAPPVACARYLRALYGYNRVRITYIGACPGADDPAIDARLTPVQFFGVLAQLDIDLQEQPEVFESVLPPDRRRHRSVPGGAPTSEMLANEGDTRALEEIIDDDWKTELAQRLLFRDRALYDVAPSLGCHCAGARPGVAPAAARPSVVALEPPRASSDVIDPHVAVDVDRTLPVIAPRVRDLAPVPVAAPPPPPDEHHPEPTPVAAPAPAAAAAPLPPPPSAPDAVTTAEEEARRRKAAAPVVARAAQTVPLARTEGGQVLPRAYAARRRTPPDGGATVPPALRAPSSTVAESPAGESRVEEPRVEEPRVEEPRVEDPRVEDPRVEDPRVEESRVEDPRVEDPRGEESRGEESRGEESRGEESRGEESRLKEARSEQPVTVQPIGETAVPDPVAIEPQPVAIAPEPPTVIASAANPAATHEPAVAQEQSPPSPRPTPRSVIVPIPTEELVPVPPAPAADHGRAAIVAAVTVVVAFITFVTFRGDDGRVTSESSGIAAPASEALESLPPLTFPLPDTGAASERSSGDTAATSPTTPVPNSAPRPESARVAAVAPAGGARPLPARTRRRLAAARRARTDSIAAAREASRRAADSVERDAIRRELEYRRARLDSIARSLDPDPSRPDR